MLKECHAPDVRGIAPNRVFVGKRGSLEEEKGKRMEKRRIQRKEDERRRSNNSHTAKKLWDVVRRMTVDGSSISTDFFPLSFVSFQQVHAPKM